MNLAERLSQLGTETAFAVSIEAARHAAAGNRVYPFHLGDLNLPTPENIQQAAVKAMQDGKTGYCPNAGVTELREALAEEINASHGTSYTADNVAIQPGGKPVIGKFIMALMNPGDAVLYPNPGFPIYESMIEFHGGTAVPYGFVEGKDSFELDMEQVERGIAAGARLMIYNDLQNPTAAESSPQELERIAALVRAGGRGLPRHPLRRSLCFPGVTARHGRALCHPLYLL
jgi:aspartate/methionine/tyrosine aminotransferase